MKLLLRNELALLCASSQPTKEHFAPPSFEYDTGTNTSHGGRREPSVNIYEGNKSKAGFGGNGEEQKPWRGETK